MAEENSDSKQNHEIGQIKFTRRQSLVVETSECNVNENESGLMVNDYRIIKELGKGAQGRVVLATLENVDRTTSRFVRMLHLFCRCFDRFIFKFKAIKIMNKPALKRKREFKRVGRRVVRSNALQQLLVEIGIFHFIFFLRIKCT